MELRQDFRLTDIDPAICGVLTFARPGEPVDVSELASTTDIGQRVVFSPDVWAACDPLEKSRDLFQVMVERDQKAFAIIKSLVRKVRRGEPAPIAFGVLARGRRLKLKASTVEGEFGSWWVVSIAA